MPRRPVTSLAVAGAVLGAVLLAGAFLGTRATRPSVQAEEPREGSVEVAAVRLGREVGLDKRVTAPAESFSPYDTIYASVITLGEASLVRLTARWRHQGALIHETTQMIAPRGETASEFHVWKPHGWAAGAYEVEILVDGVSAARREFSVH